MSTGKIARNWMQEVAATASARDLEAHMDLVHNRVQVVGEPGFEGIDYAHWVRQCSHEFENRLLEGVDYRGFKLLTRTDARIMFKTCETVMGTDATVNTQRIEILLELEDGGKGRAIQERILHPRTRWRTTDYRPEPGHHPGTIATDRRYSIGAPRFAVLAASLYQ